MSQHKVTMRYSVVVMLRKYNLSQKHRKKSKSESCFERVEFQMPARHPDEEDKWEMMNLVWEFRICQGVCGNGSQWLSREREEKREGKRREEVREDRGGLLAS